VKLLQEPVFKVSADQASLHSLQRESEDVYGCINDEALTLVRDPCETTNSWGHQRTANGGHVWCVTPERQSSLQINTSYNLTSVAESVMMPMSSEDVWSKGSLQEVTQVLVTGAASNSTNAGRTTQYHPRIIQVINQGFIQYEFL